VFFSILTIDVSVRRCIPKATTLFGKLVVVGFRFSDDISSND
jgi:hypothetical protein